ncbi:urease accessory protein UreF [Aureimonas jatrophae]|uniref:Urease accessory protein UreF n=1 Tax=Aureimonas jatrophae TaxID=1166073 RepID=A0A1H0HPB4_9HYPH|nr:urease accessory UreF family protein [Aureimonas jatrophae]MBB3950684.1 urease accessory protein [Aureimonas jatrophae]SDO20671.1 urease accessory protein [Aureimonas jatrophae]
MAERRAAITTTMDTTDDPLRGEGLALVQLLTWLSPAFPVGAFALSHGLETAVREGRVRDGAATRDWIAALLAHGSGWNDLVLFCAAYRAEAAGDRQAVREVSDLALALAGSQSRRAETRDLGEAFRRAAAPWTGSPGPEPDEDAYPVAVARLCAARAIPLGAALLAYAQGFASTLLSAALRLVPLGQSAVTQAHHDLEASVIEAARRAATSTLADLGSGALVSELCALRHETLQPRLFRS